MTPLEGYREVTFHVLEEDFQRGLTIVFLDVGCGELVPFAWVGNCRDDRPSTYTNSEGTNVVDCEVYGGTKEQLDHAREGHERSLARRGKTIGVYAHFPKSAEPIRQPAT